MRSIRSKGLALAAVASLTMFTAACGSDDSDSDTGSGDTASSEAPTTEAPTTEAPTEEPSTDGGGNTDVTANLAGPGCAAYAKQVPSGSGSVEGMSTDPVATAASNNPLLKTLTAAVSGGLNKDVDLVDTLNSTPNLTVFAPVDDAFAALPKATVTALSKPSGAETLTSILSYHVLTEQVEPSDIGGKYKTLEGGTLTVSGSPDNLKIEDAAGGASVVCGGVQTANATVYLIDSVLTPPAK